MIFKLLGACVVIACGGFYSRLAAHRAKERLVESESLLALFKYVRGEIGDYGTPLDEIFNSKGICGGVDGILSDLSDEAAKLLEDAHLLGRGLGREELRICDRLISELEAYRCRCLEGLRVEKVMARVKGLGASAAIVILFI